MKTWQLFYVNKKQTLHSVLEGLKDKLTTTRSTFIQMNVYSLKNNFIAMVIALSVTKVFIENKN